MVVVTDGAAPNGRMQRGMSFSTRHEGTVESVEGSIGLVICVWVLLVSCLIGAVHLPLVQTSARSLFGVEASGAGGLVRGVPAFLGVAGMCS